jgi:transposase
MASFVNLGMRSEGKAREKCRTNSCFLLHDNAPAHRSVLVKDFLAKNNVTTLENPPYSPDVTTAYFSPVPRPKSALKGRRFRVVFKSVRMGWKKGEGFHKMASSIISNNFAYVNRSV